MMKTTAKSNVHDHELDEFNHRGITPLRQYVVIGVEGEYFRIVDDNNEPLLYPKYLFDVVELSIPDDWTRVEFEGEMYMSPKELSAPGFYEDYFDRKQDAINIFNEYIKQLGRL